LNKSPPPSSSHPPPALLITLPPPAPPPPPPLTRFGGSGDDESLFLKEQEKSDAEAGIEKLLQKLPVSENLLFFYGEGCTFTSRVQPEIRCELMQNLQACQPPPIVRIAATP
jgi:hypothetical protein